MAVFMISSGSRRLHSRALPQSGFQGSNYIAQQKESLAASDGNNCLLTQERVVLSYFIFFFFRMMLPYDSFLPFLWGLGCEWAICQVSAPTGKMYTSFLSLGSGFCLRFFAHFLPFSPSLRPIPGLYQVHSPQRHHESLQSGYCVSICLSFKGDMLVTLCIELCPCGPCYSECGYGHPCQHC